MLDWPAIGAWCALGGSENSIIRDSTRRSGSSVLMVTSPEPRTSPGLTSAAATSVYRVSTQS